MLKAANTSIDEALKLFNGAGVATGLLVPTATGLEKSIMDATLSFRDFLRTTGVHEYASQRRGVKEYVPAYFVLPDSALKQRHHFIGRVLSQTKMAIHAFGFII